jgi:hypothetical protein
MQLTESLQYSFHHFNFNARNDFLNSGDTFLKKHSGFCNSEVCNFNRTGFSLIENKSSNYIDLIFDIKDGVVEDIYEGSNLNMTKRHWLKIVK